MVIKKLHKGTAVWIRKLKKEDLFQVVGILNKSADKLSQKKFRIRDLERILRDGARFYVAEIEGKVVGCISVKRLSGKMNHVGRIGVTVDKPTREKV